VKTIALQSNGVLWVELRQVGKRYLVKSYEFKVITRMKWFRNLAAAANDFVEVCGLDETDLEKIFHSEKKGGEK